MPCAGLSDTGRSAFVPGPVYQQPGGELAVQAPFLGQFLFQGGKAFTHFANLSGGLFPVPPAHLSLAEIEPVPVQLRVKLQYPRQQGPEIILPFFVQVAIERREGKPKPFGQI